MTWFAFAESGGCYIGDHVRKEVTSTMLRKAMYASILTLSAALPGMADTLLVDGIVTADNGEVPQRGATMQTVSSELGQPSRKSGPVGEPPITAWDYDRFVVYFEHQYVLHTVAKR